MNVTSSNTVRAVACGYPRRIKDPILQHAPTRKSVACFGAVKLRSGQFVRMMCTIFNAVTFQSFLKRLLRNRHADGA